MLIFVCDVLIVESHPFSSMQMSVFLKILSFSPLNYLSTLARNQLNWMDGSVSAPPVP